MKKYLVKVLFNSSDIYLCEYFVTFDRVLYWLRQFKYNSIDEVIIKEVSKNNSVKPLKLNFNEK